MKNRWVYLEQFFQAAVAEEALTARTFKAKPILHKEYYTRLAGMVKAGLVMKTDGRYTLTAFGNVVYNSQLTAEEGITNFWRLKAIDSLSTSKELPKEEQQKVADKLLLKNRDQRNYWKVMTFDSQLLRMK